MEDTKLKVAFAAIDKTIEKRIPSSKESENRGKSYIYWGDGDDWPNFSYDCYLNCPTLQTIVNGTADYVAGQDIFGTIENFKTACNRKGETWQTLISKLACDYLIFGICYLQIIRNKAGEIAEFYHLDSRFMRSDEYNEVFYYNKEFGKKYGRSNKTLIYPRFVKDVNEPTSVICIKTPYSRGVYGIAPWHSAVKPIMAEMAIDDFHLNELQNNFTASAIINFNNGVPSDEQMDEIEQNVQEKFVGSENAGRFVLSFNNGKDNATTIERLQLDDFDKRYETLADKTQKQIFTAFGASPIIFGCQNETNGWNAQDFKESFNLYKCTRVQPIQRLFVDSFDKIFGVIGSLDITQFNIDWSDSTTNTIVD